MKILYSQIKELVPQLKTDAKKVGEMLTMVGFMMDNFEEVEYNNQKDWLISLEVRQNRADLFGIIGVAREVAAYYNLKCILPKTIHKFKQKHKLNIEIKAKKEVKRVVAVKIDGIKNSESPKWLKKYLHYYGMNSINLLVDLSNYVMILTGYPSHLLDATKIKGRLKWTLNKNFKSITTLDGSIIKLGQHKEKEILIQDDENPLALAGIVGGEAAQIDFNTTSIIAESALYDRTIIKKNTRNLKITTEAGIRLEKDLDPTGADYALEILIDLIIKHTGGRLTKESFDYFPNPRKTKIIKFDPSLPESFAGIKISPQKSKTILKRLRFKVTEKKGKFLVTPPLDRMDIELEEDLIEEIVRMNNFEKIPVNKIPKLTVVKDITPANIKLEEKIKNILIHYSYDEILSLTMTTQQANALFNYHDWEVITTQNAINEEFPVLRQSIATGLYHQLTEFIKKNVEFIKIFEIGKIFGKQDTKYQEFDALGILNYTHKKALNQLKKELERMLGYLGFKNINYKISKRLPLAANPYSVWNIEIEGENLGIIYKFKPQDQFKGLKKDHHNLYFLEINISRLSKLLNKNKLIPQVELTTKIVTLDANVEFSKSDLIDAYLKKVSAKIKPENLWSIRIYDIFKLKNKIKYTIRVSYANLSDKEAKKLHLKIFDLKTI